MRKYVFMKWPIEAIGAPGQLEMMDATVRWLMDGQLQAARGEAAGKVLELKNAKK